MVWPSDEIWYNNMWGNSVFLGRQPRARPKEAGLSRPPNFFRPATCAHRIWETTTKFCMVIKLDRRKIFTQSTTNADMWSVCGSKPSCLVGYRFSMETRLAGSWYTACWVVNAKPDLEECQCWQAETRHGEGQWMVNVQRSHRGQDVVGQFPRDVIWSRLFDDRRDIYQAITLDVQYMFLIPHVEWLGELCRVICCHGPYLGTNCD